MAYKRLGDVLIDAGLITEDQLGHALKQQKETKRRLGDELIAEGKWNPASGAAAVSELLARGERFTALVASNDDMAIGAIKQLHESGVATPDAVSVIGFDDVAIAPYIVPSLSSVRIPVTEMIQETISRLIFMLDGGEFKYQQTFSGELILRDSVTDGPHC